LILWEAQMIVLGFDWWKRKRCVDGEGEDGQLYYAILAKDKDLPWEYPPWEDSAPEDWQSLPTIQEDPSVCWEPFHKRFHVYNREKILKYHLHIVERAKEHGWAPPWITHLKGKLDRISQPDEQAIRLLAYAWTSINRSDERSTYPIHLARIKKWKWKPPELRFSIVRHLRTIRGSGRYADLHHWVVNLESREAHIESIGITKVRATP
jgi:hypothetical protein